jgi:hypothetical protein
MPSSDVILDQLTVIANEWRWLAAVWHAAIMAILVHAFLRRPSQRKVGMLLAVPMLSVGVMAVWVSNPFNAIAFMLLALSLAVVATHLDSRSCALGSRFQAGAGLLLFAFGFLYPHFLAKEVWTAFVYMSPFGLLPCPTLAVVTGISLIFGSFGSRRWSATLMPALVVYGGIGVVVLGVWMDVVLIAGAVASLRPKAGEAVAISKIFDGDAASQRPIG